MSHGITSGMVLAAGLGTRMRPLTLTTPKPLINVAGRTMADRALDHFREAGVINAVLNISYLGDQIAAHFENRHDLKISLSEEQEPLETGGGVYQALDVLEGDAFFVMNGDAVLENGPTPALLRMAETWDSKQFDVLLLLHPTQDAYGYDGHGDFYLTADGQPSFRAERTEAPYVFTGTQILSRRTFDDKQLGKWSLREIYMEAIEKGRIKAIIHDGDWLHVGTPQGLELAEDYFAKRS